MSRARPSVYPQPAPTESYWSALDSISHSLAAATTSEWELVTETEVSLAQRELAGQVEPQVKALIQRAEDGLEELKRRERAQRAKVERRDALQARPPVAVDSEARERRLDEVRKQKLALSKEVKAVDDEGVRLRKALGGRTFKIEPEDEQDRSDRLEGFTPLLSSGGGKRGSKGPTAIVVVPVLITSVADVVQLDALIRSLLAQSRPLDSIIIVNDGSLFLPSHLFNTKNGAPASSISIQVVQLDKNVGPAAARNAGITQAIKWTNERRRSR
ncbi:hypothetical protein RQP46_001521 [Phenoliferia psychrophenolica]